jgi:hypothetical protein
MCRGQDSSDSGQGVVAGPSGHGTEYIGFHRSSVISLLAERQCLRRRTDADYMCVEYENISVTS